MSSKTIPYGHKECPYHPGKFTIAGKKCYACQTKDDRLLEIERLIREEPKHPGFYERTVRMEEK